MKYVLKKLAKLILKKLSGSGHKGFGDKYHKPRKKGLRSVVKKILN